MDSSFDDILDLIQPHAEDTAETKTLKDAMVKLINAVQTQSAKIDEMVTKQKKTWQPILYTTPIILATSQAVSWN